MSDTPPQSTQPPRHKTRDLDELRTSGLLWLINKALLHPRGYAMALVYAEGGECTGWQLHGDGSEPYAFLHEDDLQMFPRIEETFRNTKSND